MRPRSRCGGVLVLTLLIMLALELLAHGVLLLARQQAAASAADVRIVRGRAAARAAVTASPPGVPDGALDAVALGGTLEGAGPRLGDVATRWRVRRLGREAWLAEGWARVGPASWEIRQARLLRRLDPAARVAAFSAVAEVGDLALTYTAGALGSLPPREECGEATAVIDTLFPGGLPALARAPEERLERGGLGAVPWELALAAIPMHLTGNGTPAPTDSAGACVDRMWNWGDPSDPAAPCGGLRPWRGAKGDLTVEGGEGQGLLLSLGAVDLKGTVFHGVILARGDVRLGEGAEVRGLVLAGGALRVDASSRVVGSACVALAAFAGAPSSLAGISPVEGIGWLPIR